MENENASRIVGVVLAGGLARRMGGGDKPLVRLAGRSLLDHVLDRFAPQCAALVLNANGEPARFSSYRLPVVADGSGESLGPLAGILAGLEHAAEHFPDAMAVASVPGDCPFLPRDLVPRLERAKADADVAIATSGGRRHPVIGLWPVSLMGELRHALTAGGVRKVELFLSRYRVAEADWPVVPVDPFFNVNAADDLHQAERLVPLLAD